MKTGPNLYSPKEKFLFSAWYLVIKISLWAKDGAQQTQTQGRVDLNWRAEAPTSGPPAPMEKSGSCIWNVNVWDAVRILSAYRTASSWLPVSGRHRTGWLDRPSNLPSCSQEWQRKATGLCRELSEGLLSPSDVLVNVKAERTLRVFTLFIPVCYSYGYLLALG